MSLGTIWPHPAQRFFCVWLISTLSMVIEHSRPVEVTDRQFDALGNIYEPSKSGAWRGATETWR